MKASRNIIHLAKVVLGSVYFPNYDPTESYVRQVEQALRQCPWYQVYEAAEKIHEELQKSREQTVMRPQAEDQNGVSGQLEGGEALLRQ